jgi:hypothetical protein
VSDFLRNNIKTIRAAVEDHNKTCKIPARAILLNPVEHEQLGIIDVWGIPVCADERQRRGFFRVDCEGSAWQIENELAAFIDAPAVVEAPASPVERPLAARGHRE